MKDLFSEGLKKKQPLAHKMKPTKLEHYVGQEKILSGNSILRRLINSGKFVSAIFYGPPGTGKTSLAEVVSNELKCCFVKMNAVNAGVAEIKEIIKAAEKRLKIEEVQTILFLDEIHRFNKLQQDSLLPATEDGTIILIGATTENPFFSLNNSLLSRCLLFEFVKLTGENIRELMNRAVFDEKITINEDVLTYIIKISDGDARRALNYLDVINTTGISIDLEHAKEILGSNKIYFDKEEDHYNVISAFIKSIRGSDPDAALYWLGKMIAGGEKPEFIARRLVILASEDIGMANPDALNLAVSAMTAAERIGMPEMQLILSHVTVYMAISTKSNSCCMAIGKVLGDIESGVNHEVPAYLTKKEIEKYLYPHDFPDNFVKQNYIFSDTKYYIPGNNKNELLIKEKLKKLWGGKDE